ncbi:MAG: pyruvate kinase [Xanthomonadales bacterium]|nr:pyruvate kinase [Xanthomonadales bacterium]NNL94454.1 pyruvate kinase [Xanthomonadales bacterium]
MQIRRTKIIATLGPATDPQDTLEAVIKAGADVLRINMSHGSHQQQLDRAKQVRNAATRVGKEVAILADLQGPKIRIESFADDEVTLNNGDSFFLDTSESPEPGNSDGVGVAYKELHSDVEPGDLLMLDDGLISMRVERIEGKRIHCEVVNGGVLGSRKGLNLHGGGLSIPGIAEQDIADIPRAVEMEADYLAVSFPRNAEDMHQARRLLRKSGSTAALVAKIERTEAIENLAAIIDASDAVLVARGDLGVEIGDAELPGLQKRIIREALKQNRIVITATQMMQSMVVNPIPTRAEVLDVANAVIDGTDAVMLSAETAVGKHPVRVIEAMNRVCLGAERHCDTREDEQTLNVRFHRIDQAIAMAAMFMATNVSVQAIVALTESGSTAQWLSRVRTSVPIFALSELASSRRKMALYRDVYPISHVQQWTELEQEMRQALHSLVKRGHLAPGDRVIVTSGDALGVEGGTNTLRLLQLGPDGKVEHQSELDMR